MTWLLKAFSALLVVAAIGCGDDGDSTPAPEPPHVHERDAGFTAVWAEFLTVDEARAAFPLLHPHGVALNMAWPSVKAEDAELYELARAGEAEGVPVRPWLLLPEDEGYWPGSTNAEAFAALARQVMDRWDSEGLEPTWLIVDMELRFDRAIELQSKLEGELNVLEFVEFFKAGIDETQFAAATQTYKALVDEAHERGWKVLLTTLPNVLDDYEDGDDTIRQALGTPIDGVDWDLMTFQAYTTLMSGIFAGVLEGKTLTSYMVYDYAKSAQELFGDKAGLDLGLTSAGVTDTPVYQTAAELTADIEAGHAAGIPADRINVYNLEGMLNSSAPEDWLKPPAESPAAPPEDEGTPAIRQLIKTLDATG